MRDSKSLFRKVEKAEKAFLNSEFISPVIRGSKVRVRVLGLVYQLEVADDFEGWAILKPISPARAKVVTSPSILQVSEYLERLSRVRFILSEKRGKLWHGISQQLPGSQSPVLLTSGVGLFDDVLARFDGQNYWFQAKDLRSNPALTEYLRESLNKSVPLDKLRKPGLTPFHREAYRWQLFLREKKIGEVTLDKIKRALSHGGGEFKSYIERADSYTVTFSLDGEDFSSTIRKDDFEVVSAGICLSGEDRKFDLQSLVGVVKKGQRERKIYRMNEYQE
ncbi:hypothetical protein ES703_27195 [subsurface metagenome]